MSSKSIATQILEKAGIPVNSSEPWSIHIHNDRFWDRVISQKQLGLAESYMDGWWDCDAIDVMLTKLLSIDVLDLLKPSPALAFHATRSVLRNNQTKKRAASNAKHHYNIGNDLYTRMLDSSMAYSCGYWKDATTLEQAQEAKFDLIARKLHLEPGMRILDIGSGWGGFLRYVTKKYKVSAVGISPADNQISLAQIARASEKKFIIEDVHNFGPDYDKTLMQWHANINNVWDEIPEYDLRFRRMWNYYLLASAAGFRAGDLQLIQNVFTRKAVRNTYQTAR